MRSKIKNLFSSRSRATKRAFWDRCWSPDKIRLALFPGAAQASNILIGRERGNRRKSSNTNEATQLAYVSGWDKFQVKTLSWMTPMPVAMTGVRCKSVPGAKTSIRSGRWKSLVNSNFLRFFTSFIYLNESLLKIKKFTFCKMWIFDRSESDYSYALLGRLMRR